MRIKTIFLIIFFCICSITHLFARGGVIAYPVPYNPGRGSLTIADSTSKYSSTSISIELTIYDINGTSVFKQSYNSFPVLWKGYSSGGERVSSGFYILKIKIEDLNSGETRKKNIRILVKK